MFDVLVQFVATSHPAEHTEHLVHVSFPLPKKLSPALATPLLSHSHECAPGPVCVHVALAAQSCSFATHALSRTHSLALNTAESGVHGGLRVHPSGHTTQGLHHLPFPLKRSVALLMHSHVYVPRPMLVHSDACAAQVWRFAAHGFTSSHVAFDLDEPSHCQKPDGSHVALVELPITSKPALHLAVATLPAASPALYANAPSRRGSAVQPHSVGGRLVQVPLTWHART